jgi:hypothetical protein
MDINDKLLSHYNSKQYKRTFGRYSASDIYKIKKGYLTTKNFFDIEQLDMKGLKNIWRGIGLEDKLLKDFTDMEIPMERNWFGR